VILVLLAACSQPRPVVLLVSLDTTRADALSCYADSWDAPDAPPPRRTPVADQLAASGVRFTRALAHAPTTLSSHATVFSGLDPHGHGVVRNGYPVPAQVPLLAERFAAAGWRTVAAVGGSPLESAMGLDRGFAVYDDAVGRAIHRRFEDPADRVVDRLLEAIRGQPPGPLLAFAHLFDPHGPWDSAPEALRPRSRSLLDGTPRRIAAAQRAVAAGTITDAERTRARELYLSEVTWADAQMGRLLEALPGDDRLVVLLGDHGEILDEWADSPYGHGVHVDPAGIHVPLIFAGTGRFALPAGVAIDAPVGLMDVAPTVLGLADLDTSIGEGRDLRPLWSGGAIQERPLFAEATKPTRLLADTGWPNLTLERAVTFDGVLLRLPSAGPAVLRDLGPGLPVIDDVVRESALRELLAAWDTRAPMPREPAISAETAEALRSLGYHAP